MTVADDDRLWHAEYPMVVSQVDLSEADASKAFELWPHPGTPVLPGEHLALIDAEGWRLECQVGFIELEEAEGSYSVKRVLAKPLAIPGIGVMSLRGTMNFETGEWQPDPEED